ncbi:unnamed protein product, partial [Brassica oleracea]
SKQWREKDQAVESNRASGGVRWIAGGGTSGVELMEQVTERARWKSMEQTTERKVNRLSDRVGYKSYNLFFCFLFLYEQRNEAFV